MTLGFRRSIPAARTNCTDTCDYLVVLLTRSTAIVPRAEAIILCFWQRLAAEGMGGSYEIQDWCGVLSSSFYSNIGFELSIHHLCKSNN